MEIQNPDYVCCCLVAQSCLTLLQPHGLGVSSEEYWSGLPYPFSRCSSWPRDQTRIFCLGLLHCKQILYHWPQVKPRPHKHAHLIFDINSKQFSGERTAFSTSDAGTIEHLKANNMNAWTSHLIQKFTQNGLGTKCKHKLWNSEIKENPWDLRLSKMFLNLTQNAWSIRGKLID